jgi:hypothetical protein
VGELFYARILESNFFAVFTVLQYLAVRCSGLRHPTNGRIVAYSRYCGRKQTEFICFPGYQLRSSRRITCQSDGSWSAVSPTCVGKF